MKFGALSVPAPSHPVAWCACEKEAKGPSLDWETPRG
jgi:hypothetical protein